MACFLAPTVEAIVATIAVKSVQAREKESAAANVDGGSLEAAGKLPFSRKLKWLSNLLWGGSALLAFEHVWHGEVTPWFPFLTAASDPSSTAVMLRELSTVGVGMAALVTAVWVCMLVVSGAMEKRALRAPDTQSAAN